MFDASTYGLFLVTATVLVLSPGPDTVLILSRTLASGRVAGFMTLLGTQVGNIVHAVLAGIGVSTVVLLMPVLFTLMKAAGVAYLLYLAVQAWLASATIDPQPLVGRPFGSAGRYFLQGLSNNLTNPKMIVFFLALFPQFVRPERGGLAVQSMVLGTTLALMAIAWIGLWVVVVGRFREAVTSNRLVLTLVQRLAAITFVGLAVRLAIEDRR